MIVRYFTFFTAFLSASVISPAQPFASDKPVASGGAFYKAIEGGGGWDALSSGFETVTEGAIGVLGFFSPSVNYTLQYGDGIPVLRGDREKSYIHQLSPSLTMTFAERASLRYSPTFTWYSSERLNDRVNHNASLGLASVVGTWSLGLAQSYSRRSAPLVETGQQTDQESWGTSLNAGTPLGSKTSVDLSFSRQSRNTARFTDVVNWSGFAWLRYNFSSALDIAAGAGGDYSEIDPGADISSGNMQGKINWKPGNRVQVGVSAGAKVNRFQGQGRGSIVNPVYRVELGYQVFDATSISLSAHRSVDASYYADELSQSSRYNLGLSQRLFGHYSLGLGVSYMKSDYTLRQPNQVRGGRLDERWSYSATIGTKIFTRTSLSAFMSYSENISASAVFNYSSTMIGLSIGWSL